MLYFFLFIAILVLDQWTKSLAVLHLKGQSPIHIIDNHLSLLYVENRGAAFGLLQDRRLFFIVISTVVIGFLIYYLQKNVHKHGILANLAIVILIAGALGNLIDRIRLSYVVDFIALKFGGLMNFPVFNIADIAVVCGAGLLIFMMLFTKEFS